MLQLLLIVFAAAAYSIHTVRKSIKQESPKPTKPSRVSSRVVHVKPISLETQEVSISGRKEDSSLYKNPMSRAKKILNRSLLKEAILKAEILRKKY